MNNHAVQTWYDPLTADADKGLSCLFAAGYAGYPDDLEAYPPYVYTVVPDQFPSNYGVFQHSYYEPIRRFCDVVARYILANDPQDLYSGRWAHYCNRWILGFPEEKDVRDPEALGAAMARFMWDVTVGHGADHYNYSTDLSVVNKYLRIRVPPPSTLDIPRVDPLDVYTWNDTFRANMCEKLFFAPYTFTTLITADYTFEDPKLRAAAQTFKADLRSTEANLSVRNFMPLDIIPGSIQY